MNRDEGLSETTVTNEEGEDIVVSMQPISDSEVRSFQREHRSFFSGSPQSQSQSQSQSEEDKDEDEENQKQHEKVVNLVTCGCMGTQHPIITNCTYCGFIICEREANCYEKKASARTLICPFCARKGLSLPQSTQDLPDSISEGMKKAYARKDRLLQFDRENTKRTRVNDAQADYYQSDTWMSVDERRQAEERREKKLNANLKSGRSVRVTFDFMGRRVIKEDIDEVVEDEMRYKQEDEDAQFQREIEEASYWQDVDLYGGKSDREDGHYSYDEEGEGLFSLSYGNHLSGKAKEVYDEIREELINLPPLLPTTNFESNPYILQHFTDPTDTDLM